MKIPSPNYRCSYSRDCSSKNPSSSSRIPFQISRTIFDETRVTNLKVNGEDTAVTNENRTEFVQLYVDYLLNTSIARQFDALSRGFHKVLLHLGSVEVC